ncbi:MAG: hypothetical protein GY778_02945, partial [bacterium]|nr:hypothetical protein [bacterium]
MKSLRVLLLQGRRDQDPMKLHEQECFATHCRFDRSHVVGYDMVQGPPPARTVKGYDALFVGGAGDFYVSKGNLPGMADWLDFFGEIAAAGHPMFASCFGYQMFVLALGGEIVNDADNTEVGTYELRLTEEGRQDPLFSILPPKFWAQEGHKDRAGRNPDGIPNLAGSDASPLQALRIPGQPIWATQFHPELDLEANLCRFRHYVEGYAQVMTPEEIKPVLDRFQESPEANRLLPRFLDLVFDHRPEYPCDRPPRPTPATIGPPP